MRSESDYWGVISNYTPNIFSHVRSQMLILMSAFTSFIVKNTPLLQSALTVSNGHTSVNNQQRQNIINSFFDFLYTGNYITKELYDALKTRSLSSLKDNLVGNEDCHSLNGLVSNINQLTNLNLDPNCRENIATTIIMIEGGDLCTIN